MSTCKRMMLFGVLVIIASILGFSTAAFGEDGPTAAEYGVVLNLSGKQRMLTQKMSKESLLVALNHEKEKNLENLKATTELFDRTIKGLRDGDEELRLPPTVSKRIVKQLDKTKALWDPFYDQMKKIIENQAASKEDIQAIAEGNVPLLQNMNRCVKLYERDASKAGLKAAPGLAATINLSGKQRMLTQKMSKEFLLIAYGHDIENNRLNLQETANLFERTLKGLRDGDEVLGLPGTKPEHIRAQLAVVDGLWMEFKPQVETAMADDVTDIPKDKIAALASQNLPLLANMNKAVKMYEEEAAK